MAKPQRDDVVDLSGATYSRDELCTMFHEAKRRGRESLRRHPVATAVSYDRRTRRVMLSLSNRTEFAIPVELLQGLPAATPAQLKVVVVMPVGTAIEWPQLDQQFSVSGLLARVFGGKTWMRQLDRLRNGRASASASKDERLIGRGGRRPGKAKVSDSICGGTQFVCLSLSLG